MSAAAYSSNPSSMAVMPVTPEQRWLQPLALLPTLFVLCHNPLNAEQLVLPGERHEMHGGMGRMGVMCVVAFGKAIE